LKDLKTGVERVLYSGGWPRDLVMAPVISPDGAQVAFFVSKFKTQKESLYVVPAEGGASRLIADKEGYPTGWLPDGSGVLCTGGEPSRIHLIDIATGKRTLLLSHPTDGLHAASFSADGAWIIFHQRLRPGHIRLLATPYRNGKAGGPKEWVAITDGTYDDDKPRLSPDGGRLYFQSNRDGFVCLWTERLDARTKRPVGPPEVLEHYHGVLRPMFALYGGDFYNRLHLSLGADKMIVNLDEVRSDLWLKEAGK
jgi:Tol biopolymer transport system component